MNDKNNKFVFVPIGEHIYAKWVETIDYEGSPVAIAKMETISSEYAWAITDKIFYTRIDKCLRFGQEGCYIVNAKDIMGYEENEEEMIDIPVQQYLEVLDNEYILDPPVEISITPETGPTCYVHIEEFGGWAGEGKTTKKAIQKLKDEGYSETKR